MNQPSDATPRLLDTDAGPVAVIDEGEGPVLLLVHGMPGSVRDFRWLSPLLSERFRCLRMDLAGFGDTPAASGTGHNPADYAQMLVHGLDAMNIESVLAVGHSVGGAIALALAVEHPARVRALAMMAAPGQRPHRAWRRALPRPSAWILRQPLVGRALMPAAHRAFTASGFPRSTPRGAIYQAFQFAGHLDFARQRDRLARLSQPTAVVWADDDHLVEPEIPAEVAVAVPDGPRLRFPTGGHNIQKTRAAEIATLLSDWQH